MKRVLLVALLACSKALAAITYVGTGAVTDSNATASPAIPAGNVGDLIICSASHKNPNYILPTPSGAVYTELAAGNTWQYHKVWGRIATGTDTFTLASPTGAMASYCSRFRGTSTDLSAIVDINATKHFTSTSIRVNSLAPNNDNELLYYSLRVPNLGASATTATLANATEVTDDYYTAADFLTASGYWIQTTKTTSAQQDLALTPAPATADANTSILLALQPPSGGGGGGGGAWSLVGYGTAVGANSGVITPSLPTGHTSGDWLCWYGRERNTANTLAQPAGYTQIVASQTSGHDTQAIDCKIDGGSESAPSTTLIGVGMAQIVAFRGGPATITGVHATAETSNTCSTSPPSSGLSISSFGALIMSFSEAGALYGTFDANTAAPTGFASGTGNVAVNQFHGTSDMSILFGYYIYPLNTNLAAGHFTITNATTVACKSVSVAVVNTVVAPSITDVNTTDIFSATATGLVITGTNFGAAQGAGTVTIVDGSNACPQTVTAWGDTSITFNAVLGNCRYGNRSVRVTTNAATNATEDVLVQAPTGKCYFDLGTIIQPFSVDSVGAPNRFGDAANDITDNAQLEFSSMTFLAGSTCANITVNSDGSYTVPIDLTTLTWLWNNGTGGWQDTGYDRTGQGKVHIAESNGFRFSCSNAATNGQAPPTRGTPQKTICATGCTYPNTTAGITACMGATGQVCEMRSGTADGSADTWAAQIIISSISGTNSVPKTLWVRDGDQIIFSTATGSTAGLVQVTGSNYVNIQGNSTGALGLQIGSPDAWAFTCAQSPSSATFVGPTNCYPNGKNTMITGSTNVALMNMTLRGAGSDVASVFDSASDYIYLRQSLVDLHGVNDNRAASLPSASGTTINANADHFITEDTTFSHGGATSLRVTGSYAIVRRAYADGAWNDLTLSSTYTGSPPITITPNDCSNTGYGCAPYGPALVEDSDIIHSGLTPDSATYNVAMRLGGLGTIFRKNFVYSNTGNYLLSLCHAYGSTSTAYREGEQTVYNNTFWGGASFWTDASGYPVGVDARICQNALIADNLFQGARPGPKGGSEIYAFTAGMSGVPIGAFANQWKGWKVFNNIFGIDPSAPSLNMQVALTGTGSGVKALSDSSTWASNFYTNRNSTLSWVNGTTTPGQSREELLIALTSAVGVGDSAPITTTTGAGSGVTTIPVGTARPFKDDWGYNGHTWGGFHTEYGDCIAIGPTTTSTIIDAIPVRIATSGVNYSTNVLTVITGMTFQNGSPVWKAIDNGDGSCGRGYQNRGAAQ